MTAVSLIRPSRLSPGDRVRVIAPSGPVDTKRFDAGIQILANRYEPTFDSTTVLARTGYLAGDDAVRLESLHEALADESCRAIFLARGGYGLMRLLLDVDRTLLVSSPKPIVGFSDATVLLVLCAETGVASIHGPVVSQLADLPASDVESLFSLLESTEPRVLESGLTGLVPGRAEGRLIGGNLEVLSRLIGTPFEPDFSDAILFLEEVNELPYRIDRQLTHLELAGVFDRIGALVVGELCGCDRIVDGMIEEPTGDEVVAERLARFGIPVVLGGSFGHGKRNIALPFGTRVALDGGAGTLTALEPVVS